MRKSQFRITHTEVSWESLDALVSGLGVMRKVRRIAVIKDIMCGASPS